MTNKAKILTALLIISLSVVVYLVTRPKIEQKKEVQKKEEKIDLFHLEQAYKSQTKLILANYLRLAQDETLALDIVGRTKDQLLNLKVPAQFKDLHLSLVLALDKMENYINNGDQAEKQKSFELIDKAKKDYDWLN